MPHQQAGQRRHFLWGAIASQRTTGKVGDVLRQNRTKVYRLLTSLRSHLRDKLSINPQSRIVNI